MNINCESSWLDIADAICSYIVCIKIEKKLHNMIQIYYSPVATCTLSCYEKNFEMNFHRTCDYHCNKYQCFIKQIIIKFGRREAYSDLAVGLCGLINEY